MKPLNHQEKLNTFYSNFKQYSTSRIPRKCENKFLPALKKCVLSLEDRDKVEMLESRVLNGSDILSLQLSSKNSFLIANQVDGNNNYLLGVIAPNWKRGWRSLLKDESLYDIISWFFHFANQYVTRGRASEILGALLLSYGKSYNYLGSCHVSQLVVEKNDLFAIEKARSLELGTEKIVETELNRFDSSREKEFEYWFSKINGLDSFIQRAIYFYSRYIDLIGDGHFDEAITALDKVVDISHKILLDRGVHCERSNFAKEYKLDEKFQTWINQLYEVRSMFGGHASSSKWWDSGDLYGDWLDESQYMIKSLLISMFDFEFQYRLTERNPDKWSKWFNENCQIIFDSVWFHKLPF